MSLHLKILVEAGLIECWREGQFIHNRALPEACGNTRRLCRAWHGPGDKGVMKKAGAEIRFFATPADFPAWLDKNHGSERELSVGFYKRACGKASITWPESVDAALCYGWIDGVRNSIDEVSYRIRFTPRKPTSTWSAVNVKRVAELTKLGPDAAGWDESLRGAQGR